MSKTRKKKRKKTNILLGFVCILLAVLLGFILVTNYKTEQEESKHLSEIAGAQQNGIEDYEAVKKHAEELEKTAPEDTEDTDDSKSKNDKEKSAETEADTDNKENTDQAEERCEGLAVLRRMRIFCMKALTNSREMAAQHSLTSTSKAGARDGRRMRMMAAGRRIQRISR